MNRLPDDIVNVIFNFTNYDNSLFTVNKQIRRLFKKWVNKNIIAYTCSDKKCCPSHKTARVVISNNVTFSPCYKYDKRLARDIFIICKMSTHSITNGLKYFKDIRSLVVCNQRITSHDWTYIKYLNPKYIEFVNCVFTGISVDFCQIKARIIIHSDYINIDKFPFLIHAIEAENNVIDYLRETCDAIVVR